MGNRRSQVSLHETLTGMYAYVQIIWALYYFDVHVYGFDTCMWIIIMGRMLIVYVF